MGQRESVEAGRREDKLKDLESQLRGTGDLVILERAFPHLLTGLSSSQSSITHPSSVPLLSLQNSFGLAPISIDDKTYPELANVISQIGQAIVEEFFYDAEEKSEEIDWVHFLQGFQKCSQNSGENRLNLLLSIYSRASKTEQRSSTSIKVIKRSTAPRAYFDLVGYLTGSQLRDFLWLCWLLMCFTRLPKNATSSKLQVVLPNIDSLLAGGLSACHIPKPQTPSSEQSDLEQKLSVFAISSWVLSTIPGFGDCLVRYLRAQLERLSMEKRDLVAEKETSTSSDDIGIEDLRRPEKIKIEIFPSEENTMLLQPGMAWAIGLYLKDNTASEILFRASCGITESSDSEYPNLLYRSSNHGRGMNRFWTCTQGYRGLSLFLISAQTTAEGSADATKGQKFVIGGLIPSGFDNKDSFYGASSGSCLFALDPVFIPIHSTGRDKNFVYSHKHFPGAAYSAQPKPEGIGCGGTTGKERIWLNEEFETLTVRHHAVDKTYQAGSLIPNHGYAPIVSKVLDVEVWGLGGNSADAEQSLFLKRENLFTEQRRKVDLKKMFGTWQNSPEKMMMDMMGNPNAPGHEER